MHAYNPCLYELKRHKLLKDYQYIRKPYRHCTDNKIDDFRMTRVTERFSEHNFSYLVSPKRISRS